MDISKAKGTIIMFEIVHSEDPYIPDKIALSKTFALTRKNSRFIEAVVALDSNYGQDFENVEPDVKYDPEKNASNAQGMRCGSTKYWFTEMQKPGADFRKCVLGAVIAIDSTNSTHVETVVLMSRDKE